jgi:hypothetical protein
VVVALPAAPLQELALLSEREPLQRLAARQELPQGEAVAALVLE